jgi:hypothetical protein
MKHSHIPHWQYRGLIGTTILDDKHITKHMTSYILKLIFFFKKVISLKKGKREITLTYKFKMLTDGLFNIIFFYFFFDRHQNLKISVWPYNEHFNNITFKCASGFWRTLNWIKWRQPSWIVDPHKKKYKFAENLIRNVSTTYQFI